MVCLAPTDKKEKAFYLKMQYKNLEEEYKNCLGDMARLQVKRKLEKVKKELDNLTEM